MYKVGDLTFYKSHGICKVDRITEESFSGEPKLYYVLQSKIKPGVTLYHPVESENSQLERVLDYDEAVQLMDCFNNQPNDWEEKNTNRHRVQNDIMNRNSHFEIAQLMNTLLRRENELQLNDKKLASQDTQTLQQISAIIYDVLELALEQPKEKIEQEIRKRIQE